MYAFLVYAQTRPEQSEAFERFFRAQVEPSRREPGCLQYHMLRDAEDPALFIFFEVWASPEHLAVHNELPHMRDFQARRMEYLVRDIEVREVTSLVV